MEKETIELVKKMIEDGNLSQEIAEKYCPELKESEDEMIRKYIYTHFKEHLNKVHEFISKGLTPPFSDEEIKKLDASIKWIEKRGEPISYWKPTKEQYEALDYAYHSCSDTERGNYYEGVLETLMEDLHRLEKQGGQKTIDEIAKEVCKDKKSAVAFLKSAGIINEKGELAEQYRQSEQKTTDKVEPMFKVGDWIYHEISGNTIHINKIEYGLYVSDEGATISLGRQNNWRIWTIQDAKDGDVVVDKSDGTIGIFQSIGHHPDGGSYNDPSYCFLHCRYDDEFFYADFENGNTMDSDDAIPAAKEQRDLLFQKMKEAGYEWDDDKKELKKIVAPIFHIGDRVRYKGHACDGVITEITDTDYICGNAKLPISTQDNLEIVEHKPSWSEEDERIRIETIELLETANHPNVLHRNGKPLDFTENINWLKSLRPQKPLTNKEIEQAKKEYRDVALSKMDYIPEELTYDNGWDDAISYMKKSGSQVNENG